MPAQEIVFNIKDIVYIGLILIAGGASWESMRRANGYNKERINNNKGEIDKVKEELKEEVVKKEVFNEFKSLLSEFKKGNSRDMGDIKGGIKEINDRCLAHLSRCVNLPKSEN